jgi:predicted ATPase
VKKIVLTGGPCSGKTTFVKALHAELGDRIMLAPEAATLLLANGFPNPGTHVSWSPAWQAALQSAILPLQLALEDACTLVAQEKCLELIVCDRGALDGAAYTPGGVEEFCRQHQLDLDRILARYEAVIHLESLATAAPEMYGTDGNLSRFEALAEAQRLEHATRSIWSRHPRHLVIAGSTGFDKKRAQVLGHIRALLSPGERGP